MDIERKLQAALYRIDCPGSTVLGDYHLQLLDSGHAAAVGRHVEQCPHCTTELALLASFLEDVGHDLERSPAERLRLWLGRLLAPPGGATALQPALALRGDERPPLTYEAGPSQILIEMGQDPEDVTCREIIGLILQPEGTNLQAMLLATHENQSVPVVGSAVDDLGGFVLFGVLPGQYDLFIEGGDVRYEIRGLTVE